MKNITRKLIPLDNIKKESREKRDSFFDILIEIFIMIVLYSKGGMIMKKNIFIIILLVLSLLAGCASKENAMDSVTSDSMAQDMFEEPKEEIDMDMNLSDDIMDTENSDIMEGDGDVSVDTGGRRGHPALRR